MSWGDTTRMMVSKSGNWAHPYDPSACPDFNCRPYSPAEVESQSAGVSYDSADDFVDDDV